MQIEFFQQFGPVFGADDQWQFGHGQLEVCSVPMADFLECGAAIRNQVNLQELTLRAVGGAPHVAYHRQRVEKYAATNTPPVIMNSLREQLARAEQCCPLESFWDAPVLRGIKHLRFEKLALYETELESFAAAPFLQEVESLYVYLFTDARREMYRRLGQLSSLRQLELQFYSDSGGDRCIDVGGPQEARALAASRALSGLRSLALRYHEIGNRGMLDLVRSERLASLENLDLRGNFTSITNSGLAKLANLPAAARLRRLNLSECKFDEDGAMALLCSPHLSGLEELYLQCSVGREPCPPGSGRELAAQLSRSDCLPQLRSLDLSCLMIGDEGLHLLSRSPRFGSFQRFDLWGHGITDEGFVDLAQTSYPPSLRDLNLVGTSIGARGFTALAQSLIAKSVVRLSLPDLPDLGSLLANSRFDSVVELRVKKLDASLLEALTSTAALPSLRRIIFRFGASPGELLERKHHEPAYLLNEMEF